MPFSIKFKASHKSLHHHLKFNANLSKAIICLKFHATHKIKFKLYF
ncbi:hypothetical protein UNSWCS_55 [Campylobacter concisus UNSWCS]|uniref:Uncharacterized protein n=1 Tax=Campylobacter concisus UNSWCS TaxID=1242968 RepID=U2GKY9_9BACT|nr:hypothetical protein UNSWCS_55 [Campylobacter concisus UNSWCS]